MAFQLDPEKAHTLTLKTLSCFPRLSLNVGCRKNQTSKYWVKEGRMCWHFPIGLAAGLDKNGECLHYFSHVGFGGVEVGTITPRPQPGNEKPRLFRYPEEKSLRNRMGFNNQGADGLLNRVLEFKEKSVPLGINLGKNKTTTQEHAVDDYVELYQKFSPIADYLVINVSSPNTPGLRDLQKVDQLKIILEGIGPYRQKEDPPLFLKISPDMNLDDCEGVVQLCSDYQLEGIIATNTTIMKEKGPGGISGDLLYKRSHIIRLRLLELTRDMPLSIIGVGGISEFRHLWDFWKAGGKFCQIYTSFIYQGPFILEKFEREIDRVLKKNGCQNLMELLSDIDQAEY